MHCYSDKLLICAVLLRTQSLGGGVTFHVAETRPPKFSEARSATCPGVTVLLSVEEGGNLVPISTQVFLLLTFSSSWIGADLGALVRFDSIHLRDHSQKLGGTGLSLISFMLSTY